MLVGEVVVIATHLLPHLELVVVLVVVVLVELHPLLLVQELMEIQAPAEAVVAEEKLQILEVPVVPAS
jgi:hypothetical protein